MPKQKTKFTAQFTAKLGRTPVEIKIPLDLADFDPKDNADAVIKQLGDEALTQLQQLVGDAKIKFANQGDIKRAFKTHAKAQIAAAQS